MNRVQMGGLTGGQKPEQQACGKSATKGQSHG